jgi:hypothetical protein
MTRGSNGVEKMKSIYVIIPRKAENINRYPLFPNLSTEIPIKGIINEEMKKGRAIANPTAC